MVVAQSQVTVGAAVFQVLIAVEVERAVAHERIAEQGTLPLAAIEVVVTDLHLGLHGLGRSGILIDEALQSHQAAVVAPLKTAQSDVIVGLLTHRGVGGQLLHVLELVDGTHIVVRFIHLLAALEIAGGLTRHHARLCHGHHGCGHKHRE